jgi:hypothetical protein
VYFCSWHFSLLLHYCCYCLVVTTYAF